MNIISSSCGNDSVALIQWAIENEVPDLVVTYLSTGWAAPGWNDRVDEVANYCNKNNIDFIKIESMGMAELIKMKKAWPANQYQFCTQWLKGVPFLNWIDNYDPNFNAKVLVGKRRVESRARADTPEYIYDSEYHGGRTLWHPLYKHTDEDRNELLNRAGFKILPHRSNECFPCINSNRSDFLRMTESDIERVEKLEVELGKPAFRPKRFNAMGIRGVVFWAHHGPISKREKLKESLKESGCQSAYGCGI